MKSLKSFVLFALLALAPVGPAVTPARADVSFSVFFDSLRSHGDWIEVDDYGYCWRPDVDDDWRPYTDGYWSYSDAGWTWVSYEDYGWAVYHYGRWTQIDDEGWCWVPGNEWGPGWVSWRSDNDYVGWAPLPPEARWNVNVGFSVNVDADYDIGPNWFSFCHTRDFGAPVLRGVILDRRDNVTIINRTTNITNITINNVNKVVYNGGPNYTTINKVVNRPIQVVKIKKEKNIDNTKNVRVKKEGNTLIVPAPDIDKTDKIRPDKVTKKVKGDKVNRGWSEVKDPTERERMKKKIAEDGGRKGPNHKVQPVGEDKVKEIDEAIAQQPKRDKLQNKPGKDRPNVGTVETLPAPVNNGGKKKDKGLVKDQGPAAGNIEADRDKVRNRDKANQPNRQEARPDNTAAEAEAQAQARRRAEKQRQQEGADQKEREQRRAERTRQEQNSQQAETRKQRDGERQQAQQAELNRARRQQEQAAVEQRRGDNARQQRQQAQQQSQRQEQAQEAARRQRQAERQQQAAPQQRQAENAQRQEAAQRQQRQQARQQEAQQQQQPPKKQGGNKKNKQQGQVFPSPTPE